jgi:hypothetical protein
MHAKSGYRRIKISGTVYLAHRIIASLSYEIEPDALPPFLDHKDTNRAYNAVGNLRPATAGQNARNRGASARNLLGVKGVSKRSDTGNYEVKICFQGTKMHLGTFYSAEAASEAYRQAAERLHKDFARAE